MNVRPSLPVALLTLAVGGGLGAGVTLAAGRGSDASSTAPAEPPGIAVAPPSTERPTAQEIAEAISVDSGVTAGQVVRCNAPDVPEELCPLEDQEVPRDRVSYGIVVENTSDLVVINLPVTFRFVDGSGAVVPLNSDLAADEVSIPRLRPGDRFGLGDVTYVDGPGVTGIEVEIGDPIDWMPEAYYERVTGDEAQWSRNLTATNIAVSFGPLNEPSVGFTAESRHEEPVPDPWAYAVFRNRDGEVVGGTHTEMPGGIPAGGSLAGEIDVVDMIEVPGLDPMQIEVYVSPFNV